MEGLPRAERFSARWSCLWKNSHFSESPGGFLAERCLSWSETPRLSVGLRVRAISLFGTRVVWSKETELPSLLLCPVTRAGEISLATRGCSERNLLPLFALRMVASARASVRFLLARHSHSSSFTAVFTAVFTQLSWLRKISLPLSFSLTLGRHHWSSTSQTRECLTSASTRRNSWLGSERKHRLRSKRVQKRSSVNSKYRTNLQQEELPAQACFEEFREKLAAGMLQAEPLDQVIPQAEAEEQDRKKPDPPRQYGMHLNATLTNQTRRRYTSSLPKNLEELRQKYDVLSNCWLLGQQRQQGRALHSGVDSSTFPRILKELLGKKNFALKKELEGKPLVAPPWAHCHS